MGIATTSCSLGTLIPGAHTWSVLSHGVYGDTPGPTWSFQAHSAAPGAVSNLAPANGATMYGPVTFSWNAASDATAYDLMVDGLVAYADLPGTISPPANLSSGAHTWQVVAKNGCGDASGPVWALTVVAIQTVPEFLPVGSFPAGTSPRSIGIADLNRDGIPDVVVTNSGSANISILSGNGTGGFGSADNEPVGGSPHGILLADFGRDNKVDIAVANNADGTITVLTNFGAGVYNPVAGSPFAVGTAPEALATADFNRDGILDLAVTNSGSGTVSILLGTNVPSFGAATNFSTGGTDPQGIAAADFNIDGRADLVIVNAGSSSARVLWGDGLGGFSLGPSVPVGIAPQGVAVGDFNLDGRLDFVTVNHLSSDLDLVLGDGTGIFSSGGIFPAGTSPEAVVAGDINNDGWLDAIIADSAANAALVLLGTSSGFAIPLSFAAGLAPSGIAAADLNHDGGLDLALPLSGSNSVAALVAIMGTGDSLCFSAPTTLSAGWYSQMIVTGDFNFDGNVDLAVSSLGDELVRTYFGNGLGGFTLGSDLLYVAPFSLAAGDLNRDGHLDLAFGEWYYNDLPTYLGSLDGSFSLLTYGPYAGTYPDALALADLNRDGILDAVSADEAGNVIYVFLGIGDGNLQSPGTTYATGTDPVSLATADFNRDGKLDVAIANYGSNDVTLKLGNGTGGFTSSAIYPAGTNPTGVVFADFNADGRLDLAVSNYSSDDVTVKLANATANGFTSSINYPAGTAPAFVQAADMNGDGRMDLITTNFIVDEVNILLGNGAGAFAAPAGYSMGISPRSLAAVDINHDGKLDIVTVDRNSSTLSVRTSMPSAVSLSLTAPASVAGGAPFDITVTVLDACGGVATGYAGTVHFTSSDPLAVLPPDTTFSAADSGVKTLPVTLQGAGSQTITATDTVVGALTDSASTDVRVFTKLQILLPGETAAPGTPTGKTGAPANQAAGTSFNVTVNAVDPDWYPIASITDTVAITASDLNATLPAGAALVGGTRIFSVTLNTVGTWTVTASDSTNGAITPDTSPGVYVESGAFAKLQLLVPGEAAAPGTPSGKTGTPLPQTAGVPFNVTVYAVDALWNHTGTTDDTVGITSSDPHATLPADGALAFGMRSFSVTLLTSGMRTVTATDISDGLKTPNTSPGITVQPAAFTGLQLIVPGETAAPGTPTGKTGTPTARTAAVLFSVTINAVDAYWNRVTTVTDTIHLASTDAAAVLPADGGLVAGTRTFTNGVSLKTIGSWSLTASDVTDSGITTDTSPLIPVVVGPFAKLQILVPGETAAPGMAGGKSGAPAAQTAGVPFNVTVNAVDANWYLINTVIDTVAITSSDANAVLPPNAALVAGTQIFSVTLKTGGGRTVTAADVTDGLKTPNTSPSIAVGANAFTKLQILVPGEIAAPGTTTGKTGSPSERTAGAAFNVTVNAVDDYWNRVTSVSDTVGFTSTDELAVLPAALALASGTRTYTNGVTLRTAGIWTITATDTSDGLKTPNTSPNITVVLGPFSKLQILVPGETAAPGTPSGKTGTPLPQTAGVPFDVTVNAVNANWYPMNTVTDTVAITSSDANAVLPVNAALVAGTQTFSVTLKTAGVHTATATDNSGGGILPNTSPGISVVPNTCTKLQILVPGETAAPGTTTGKTGSPTNRTAAVAFNVIVNAVDDNWNKVTSVTDTFHLDSSTDPDAVFPPDQTLSGGTRTVTGVKLRTPGTQTITASDVSNGSIASNTSPGILVVVGAFVKLQILVPGETAAPGTTTGKTGTPSARTAGVPFDVTVNAVDANWYIINTVIDTVAITSSDANAVLPSNAALVAGTRTFSVTLKTAGVRTVTATDASGGGILPNTSPSITVVPNAFTKLQVLVPGETAAPGTTTGKTGTPLIQRAGTALNPVVVNAVDDYWNTISSVTDIVHFDPASTDPAAILPADTALVAGTRTYTTTTLITVGTWTLTVSDVTDGGKIPGTSAPIIATVGPFVKLQILAPGETAAPGTPAGKTGTPTTQTAGVGFTVTVNAVDSNWYPIGSVTDTVGITSSDTHAALPANAALVNGTQTFDVTLKAGTSRTVTATDITDGAKSPNTSSGIPVAAAAFVKMQILVPGETADPGSETGKTGTPTNANAAASFNVTVSAVDDFWNPVTSITHTVHLASTDATATLPGDSALVNGTGVRSVTFNTVPGPFTITLSDVDDGTKPADTSPPISVVTGEFVKLLILLPGETAAPGDADGKTGTPTAQTAGVPFNVTVYAVNASWYPIGSVTDTVHLATTATNPAYEAFAVLPADTPLVGGTMTFPVTMRKPVTGSPFPTITASDVTNPGKASSTSPGITVNIGAFVKLQILVPGETAAPGTLTGKTGTPSTLNAGAPLVSIIVNAVDSCWNKVTSITHTIHFSTTDPAAVFPADTPLVSGTKPFSTAEFRTAGNWTITVSDVTDGTKLPDTSPSISVIIGPFTMLQILVPGETAAPGAAGGKTGTPNAQTAGVPFDVTVYAVDANYYPIDTVTSTVHLATTPAYTPYAVLPADTALVGGMMTFSVTLRKTATATPFPTLTASDVTTGKPSSTSPNIRVNTGAFAKLQILVPGEIASPGSLTGKTGIPTVCSLGASLSITINAVDDCWNKVTTVTHTVHLSSTDPAALIPTNDVALASGARTFTDFEFRTVGAWTITASDVTDGSKTPDTCPPISVVIGPFSQLQVLLPGETADPGSATGKFGTPITQTAGVPFTIVINAVNAEWYLINTVTDTVAITTADDPNAVLPPNAALSAGTGTFSVILKTAGTRHVTASDFTNPGMTANTSSNIIVGSNEFTKLQILVPGETAAPGTPTGKTGTPNTQLAGAAIVAIVNACDDYWNKVPGKTDTVHLSSTDPAAFMPADLPLSNGTRTYISPNSPELRTVGSWTMTVEDVTDVSKLSQTSPPIPVTLGPSARLQILVPGETAAPGTTSGKTGTPAPQTAGVPFNVIVNAVDANWYVITSATDTVHITSTDANAVLPSDAALAFGTATLSVTLKTGGPRTVTASDLTPPALTANTSPTISVVANEFTKLQLLVPGEIAAPGTESGKTGTPTTQLAGAEIKTLVVNAVDDYWNKVTTVTDTVHLSSTDPAAFIPPADEVLVSGTVTFNPYPRLQTVGSWTMTIEDVTDGIKPSDTSPPIPVVLGSFTKLQVLVPGETAAPGTTTGKVGTPLPQVAGVPFIVTVNAVTDYWYLIDTATDTVSITSSDTYATLPPDAAMISGTQTFSVTLKTAGSRTVTATDASGGGISAGISSGIPVGAAAFSKLQILVPGETAVPGSPTGKSGTPTQVIVGTFFTSVTVNAVDEFWNRVTTVTDMVHLSSTDPLAVIPADAALGAGTKKYTNLVKLRTIGNWTLTAADVTDAGKASDTSPGIEVVLGEFIKLQVLVPGETAAPGTSSGKTGTPTPQTANVPFEVTVNAVNTNWYLVDTVSHTVAITSSDAFAILPPNADLSGGTQTFAVTLKGGPSRTVTATDVSPGPGSPNTSTSIPVGSTSNFVRLQILAPGETAAPGGPPGKIGTPTARKAGSPFNVAVNAVDEFWNRVTTVTDTVHILSSDSNATLPANIALAGGTKSLSVTLRTAGTATVTVQDATDPGKPEDTTPPLTVNPNTFTKLQILVPGETANPGSTTGKTGTPSGQAASVPFMVEVNAVDASWNRITTVGDTVRITSTDGSAVLPPNAALVLGTQAFEVTFNTYGNQRLTASDVTTPARTPNQSPDIFVGSTQKLQILLPGEMAAPGGPPGKTGTPALLAAGIPFNVIVNAVDANWNVLAAVADTVALTSTDGSATLPVNTPLVSGTVTLSVTFSEGGNFTVTASDVTDIYKSPNTSPSVTVIGEAGRPSVAPLVWTGADKDTLEWGAAINATSYNLYRGTMISLPDLLTGTDDSCLRWSGAATTTGPILTQTPAAGELYWYLVRGVNSGVEGTPGNGTAGLRILNSSGSCP